jgi:hypothetical protein
MVKAMSNWYYCKNKKQSGPITLDELKGMVASGDLADTLPVWKIGTSHWIKIRKCTDLISSIPTPPPPPVSTVVDQPLEKAIFTRILDAVGGKSKGKVQ